MKSFLKNMVARKDPSAFVGRTITMDTYTIRVDSQIGEGGFATIYKVSDLASRQAYALKHVRLGGDREAIRDCNTEVQTMMYLRGKPHILTVRAVAYAGPKGAETECLILMDLCKEGLVDYMRRADNKLPDGAVLEIFQAVCQGVAAMHGQQPPLSHWDLKAENVLLHKDGSWVLCDFGSSTSRVINCDTSDSILMEEDNIRRRTTPAYRAPEMWDLYERQRIDTKADIWALGCLFYFMCYGQLPFGAEEKLKILNGHYTCPKTRPPAFQALLAKLLTVSPAARPDIEEVLRCVRHVAQNATAGLVSSAGPAGLSISTSEARQAALQQPQPKLPAVPFHAAFPSQDALQQQQQQQPKLPAVPFPAAFPSSVQVAGASPALSREGSFSSLATRSISSVHTAAEGPATARSQSSDLESTSGTLDDLSSEGWQAEAGSGSGHRVRGERGYHREQLRLRVAEGLSNVKERTRELTHKLPDLKHKLGGGAFAGRSPTKAGIKATHSNSFGDSSYSTPPTTSRVDSQAPDAPLVDSDWVAFSDSFPSQDPTPSPQPDPAPAAAPTTSRRDLLQTQQATASPFSHSIELEALTPAPTPPQPPSAGPPEAALFPDDQQYVPWDSPRTTPSSTPSSRKAAAASNLAFGSSPPPSTEALVSNLQEFDPFGLAAATTPERAASPAVSADPFATDPFAADPYGGASLASHILEDTGNDEETARTPLSAKKGVHRPGFFAHSRNSSKASLEDMNWATGSAAWPATSNGV